MVIPANVVQSMDQGRIAPGSPIHPESRDPEKQIIALKADRVPPGGELTVPTSLSIVQGHDSTSQNGSNVVLNPPPALSAVSPKTPNDNLTSSPIDNEIVAIASSVQQKLAAEEIRSTPSKHTETGSSIIKRGPQITFDIIIPPEETMNGANLVEIAKMLKARSTEFPLKRKLPGLEPLEQTQSSSINQGTSDSDNKPKKIKLKDSKEKTVRPTKKSTPCPSLAEQLKTVKRQNAILERENTQLKSEIKLKEEIIERYKEIFHQRKQQPPTAGNILGTIADTIDIHLAGLNNQSQQESGVGGIASGKSSQPGPSHQKPPKGPLISQEKKDFLLSENFIKQLTGKGTMSKMCNKIVERLWDEDDRLILYKNKPHDRPLSEIRKIKQAELDFITTVLARVVKHPDWNDEKLVEDWPGCIGRWVSDKLVKDRNKKKDN